MQVATIVPTAYLDMLEDRPYHMALAHLLNVDYKYTDFYKNQVAMGHYVIVDNSIMENAQQTIDVVCERAISIGAQEVILPDVFQDMEGTLQASLDALELVKIKYPSLKTMAVPQGATIEEWIECAKIMLSWPIDCLGIPKVLATYSSSGRLEVLHTLGSLLRGVEVHLLGCWYTPIEVMTIAKAAEQGDILPVRGVDSSIAYVYSREGLLISQTDRPTGAVDFSAHDADREFLLENIKIWENCVNVTDNGVCTIY